MALILYDGTLPTLAGYSTQPWDHPSIRISEGHFKEYNEDGGSKLRALIQKLKPRGSYVARVAGQDRLISVDFAAIEAAPPGNDGYLVKCIHQEKVNLIYHAHFTIAFEGYIWHINVFQDSKRKVGLGGVTRGEQYADVQGFIG